MDFIESAEQIIRYYDLVLFCEFRIASFPSKTYGGFTRNYNVASVHPQVLCDPNIMKLLMTIAWSHILVFQSNLKNNE